MENTIGLKELRENMSKYTNKVARGESFVIYKQSKPLFKMLPINKDEQWEEVIDFTKIKKGGVNIDDILSRL